MRARTTLSRVHALTGAFPLAAWLVVHLVEVWSALGGRAEWNARIAITASPGWLVGKGLLVLVPLVLHAALGVRGAWRGFARREEDDERASRESAYGGRGLRALQWGTGLVALVFLVAHLAQLWLPLALGHVSGPWLYEVQMVEFGTPLWIGVQAAGLAAVCLHVAQGVPAALVSLGFVEEASAHRRARIVAGALALLVWMLLVDVTSHFASGAALAFERTPRLPTAADVDVR